jgi:hypothetical protein
MTRVSKAKQIPNKAVAPDPIKPLTLYLPLPIHTRVKMTAARTGTTMNKLILPLLSKWLKEIGS